MTTKNLAILILAILVLPTILAATIGEFQFTIKAYNNTVEIINSDYSGNHKSITVNITDNLITNSEVQTTFLLVKNESVDSDLVESYATCLGEKSTCALEKQSFNSAWNGCVKDLNSCIAKNVTDCQTNLTQCTTNLGNKQSELDTKISDYSKLEEEKKGSENSRYLFILIGAAAIALIWAFKAGKIGGLKITDQKKDFNPNQAA